MQTGSREFFPQLAANARHALEHLPAALDAVWPLKAAHRRDLPAAVRDLSARLTCERGGNERPYWSNPRLVSAYLWYFLPWNLARLIRLLGALDLPHPPADAAQRPLLLDIGSGPLTLPLALWLAKPEWQALPLEVACLDSSPRALELGRELFARLAGEKTAWRIVPVRANITSLARAVRGRPWLISAVNVLNELKAERASDHLAGFAEQAAWLLHPQGAILCVEPGTRLGGKLVQSLREKALALGLVPVRPCTHARSCPLQGSRSWCHFSLGVQGTPDWLARLAREARLPKQALHLSFALLQRQPVQGHDAAGGAERLEARVISAPFKASAMETPARYACSARGLLLLTRAADAPAGALVEVQWPARPRRDERSGAWIL